MKEELQGKLVEILSSIQAAAGKASDFAMDQLPDIAQSYVAYGRAANTIGALLMLALAVTALLVALKLHAIKSKTDEYYDGFYVWFPALFAVGIPSGLFLMALPQVLLVWLAPKVWLVKEIARMLK